MNITELETKTRDELIAYAKEIGVTGVTSMKKEDLVMRLLQANAEQQGYTGSCARQACDPTPLTSTCRSPKSADSPCAPVIS